jgi:hypothetical protein
MISDSETISCHDLLVSLHAKVDMVLEQNRAIAAQYNTLLIHEAETKRRVKNDVSLELEVINQRSERPSTSFFDWVQESLQGDDWLHYVKVADRVEEALLWVLKRAYTEGGPVCSMQRRKVVFVYEGGGFRLMVDDDVRKLLLLFQCRAMCLLEDWKAQVDQVFHKKEWFADDEDDEDKEENPMNHMQHFQDRQYMLDTNKITRLDSRNDRTVRTFARRLHTAMLECRLEKPSVSSS